MGTELLNQAAFNIGAMMLSATCLVYSFIQRHTDKPQNRLYIASMVNLMLSAVCNIVQIVLNPMRTVSYEYQVAIEMVDYAYFLLHSALALFMFYYALFATHTFQRIQGFAHVVYLSPFLISEAMVLLNPFFHWVYDYGEGYAFTRASGEAVIYVAAVIYSVLSIWCFARYWHDVTKTRRRILIVSVVCMIVALVVQMLIPEIQTELFGEAVLFFGLMLAVEYNEDRMDAIGINNRRAFLADLSSHFESKSEFYVICIRITNLETVQRILGMAGEEVIITQVVDYLKTIYPKYLLYRPAPSALTLLVPSPNTLMVETTTKKIRKQFLDGFTYREKKLPIHGVILVAKAGEDLSSEEDVLLMCESAVPTRDNAAVLQGEQLEYLYHQAALERALHKALSRNELKIYYQPVYETDSLKITSAESSIRIEDEDLGELFPSDFIKTAERIGVIEQMGDYLLNEVCRFIQTGKPQQMGIEFINVNLSIVQCMRPDFVKHITDVLKEHGVRPSMINFEVHEYMAYGDYDLLDRVIHTLKREGFRFTLTGYGTGYSDLYSIFMLDFDIIKMDRSILQETTRNSAGWIVLENSIRLIHELSREVIVVGVETDAQIERLRELAGDYVQGYYFSHPMSEEQLLQLGDLQ